MQVIIYANGEGGVSVIYPCDCGLTIEEIAKKDVPEGLEYAFIEDSALPDRSTREAWKIEANTVVVDPAKLNVYTAES